MDATTPANPTATRIEQALVTLVAHRNSWWLWLSVVLMVAIYFLARHMVGVALFKLALLTIAMYVGYVGSLAMEGAIGSAANRRKRPHEYMADADAARAAGDKERGWQLDQFAAAMLWRRAMIVSAAMLAVAMGG